MHVPEPLGSPHAAARDESPLSETRTAHTIAVALDALELAGETLAFVQSGLARREGCLYVTEGPQRNEVVKALTAGGVRVEPAIAGGELVLIDAREFGGPAAFEAARMAALVRRRVAETRRGGYARLRIASEMTWTLGVRRPEDALVAWESLADEMTENPVGFVCMYRRDRFEPGLLRRLVRAHEHEIASDLSVLSLTPALQSLTRADLQVLIRVGREIRVSKNEYYFHQGDRAADVYVLMDGLVKLERTDSEGRSVVLGLVGAAEGFGLIPLFGRATRQNSAQALLDARALVWDGAWLREFVNVRTEPMFWDAVSAQQARLLEAQSRIADFSTVPPESRLARLLQRLADSFGLETSRGVAIGIGISRRDLAAMVGASPYTVSRTLARWRQLDILDAHRKRILIRNPRRLAELAEDAATG